jgi:4-hydroxybenzoate-CoA ligase
VALSDDRMPLRVKSRWPSSLLRDGFSPGRNTRRRISCAFVADRLTHYKQPRQVHFVEVVPKTASGKILRRELKQFLR